MQANVTELISDSRGCSRTGAQEYLDSKVRYLHELQGTDDLRGDGIRMACSNLGLDPDYQEYFINRLTGA